MSAEAMQCGWACKGAINGVEKVFRCSLFRDHPDGHKCFIDGMTLNFVRGMPGWARDEDPGPALSVHVSVIGARCTIRGS